MTLIEVIDAARNLAGEPLDSTRNFPDNTSTFWTDSQLITYVNMVQHEVANEIVQAFEDYFVTQTNLSVVSGCADYTLPARFIKVRRVEDIRNPNNPSEVYPITMNEKESLGNQSLLNGSSSYWPGGYYIRGNQIVLTDTPTFTDTSAIRMYYVRALANITSPNDSSEIPVEHHRVLVWGLIRMMRYQEEADTGHAHAEYEKSLVKLKQQCEDRQIQRPRRVKSGLRGRI